MTSCTEKTNVEEVWNKESLQKLQSELLEFENSLHTKIENLQNHLLDDSRENIPESNGNTKTSSISDIISRIHRALKIYKTTEEEILIENKNLQKQIEYQESALEEIQMERDVLLERIHTYLETNSSLKIRLEEQRCQTASLQRQLDGDLEAKARVLEKDNERLNEMMKEKDKELKKMNYMLEKIVNKKVEKEEIIENLRKKLNVVLVEKTKVEEENKKLNSENDNSNNLKRSFSADNIYVFRQCSKPFPKMKMIDLDPDLFQIIQPTPCLLSSARVKQNSDTILKNQDKNIETNKKTPEPAIHVQLNALRSGLVNVTHKLKVLKSQLITSNSPLEAESKDVQKSRNLKRKAEPLETQEVEEEPKDRKNLKDILEDAKNLNAKLQNLREEKQKIIETSKQSFVHEKYSQTYMEAEEPSPNISHVQKVIDKLRMTLTDCEDKLDKEEINKDEASEVLLSAFSSCVFSNLRYFHESEKRGVNSLKDEIDMELLMDGKSKESKGRGGKGEKEKEERREDGGGDNQLKKKMESDMRGCEELKFRISKIKLEIENFKKLEA